MASSENGSHELSQESITLHDVETAIECAVGPTAKVIDYHVEPYAPVKIGFLGLHLRLQVTIQPKSGPEETRSFFIKCIPDSEGDVKLITESSAFVKETTFYKHVMPELIKNFDGDLWSPSCYLIKDDMLVFDDLKPKNFRMPNMTFDANTLESALASLARFHAASIIAEKRLGKSFYEIYPGMFKESIFDSSNETMKSWFVTGTNFIVALAKSLGLDHTGVRDCVERIFELVKSSPTKGNIICHSDLWANNILINDESPPKCMLIDYQLVRYIPGIADVLQLIYVTTGRAFRDASEKKMVEHYHEVLCKTVKQNNREIELQSLEELLEDYEEYRCYGAIITALYSQVIRLDNDYLTELAKDPEAYAKFLMVDRCEAVMKLMEKDMVYKEKMLEIVTEVVELSHS